MEQVLNVLIIEDHPFVVEVYSKALNQLESNFPQLIFNIDSANNGDEAHKKIESSLSHNTYDLVILDIRIPPSSDGKIISGEDLGERIREVSKKSKIIVSTNYSDNYRLNNIVKTIDPDGFLIKADIDFNEISETIKAVIYDPPYYSKTVLKFLRKQINVNFIFDQWDRKLLYLISIGIKTKDLPKEVPLSIASIERRKRNLKKVLVGNSNDDISLIRIAKEKGFL